MDTETESDITVHKYNRKYTPKLTIRVTNNQTGAVYVHKHITKGEADWIDLDPNLTVEVLKR
jgi:hypothetical protein